mmetsp:Transcript_474/g.1638  ORF Transcript_474/g.1638 Transcript_474/m.1638 type:complete len:482 (+) Transcript_474:89-1534(+)|eukprot:CAMPEP_0198729810 /NCGR_PEP_ID=MMETSP1475-20131203/21047_1 /TAXON_ID= ORGANISM="Unidentified sp., Strain CCMP1999" /NCGR_SAMPLE_ID=MMETSP1475 /ASSEMBLY_ACC=CAM_ASM_001111 /LENGTH=481 /DNA_ID=CAMNT_0044492519 /DNA_START=43 /DNA_END=1488 /DNA_ORIENTATION=-
MAFVGGFTAPTVRPGSFALAPQRVQIRTCSTRRRAVACKASLAEKERTRLNFKDVDDRVITAVERLGDRRLTVSDVASAAGLGIDEAEKGMMQLSQMTGGKLEVSNSGDIIFSYADGVRRTLQRESLRATIREQFRKYWPILFYLIRISFGLFLFLSIFIVFTAISILSSSSERDSRDRRDYGGYYSTGPRFFGPNLFDVFYWNNFQTTYYAPSYQAKPQNMNFLESIFSFVFGDGDPNRGLDEKKWKAIAATIRANDGAVTAEQLAPFLDPPEDPNSRDESFVIPVLLRFKGKPEVTNDGDIVYIFPEMTKMGANVDSVADPKGRYIEEEEWQFSKASSGQKLIAGSLGVLNLFGVLTLSGLLNSPQVLQDSSPAFVAAIKGLYPLLAAYAATFIATPIARWFWIQRRNVGIKIRNAFRKGAAMLQLRPSEETRRKQRAARQYATERSVIRDEDLSFSSDKEVSKKDDDDFQDFDKRLRS